MKNYFVYLPENPSPTPWECATTACGYTRVPPGSPYPPVRHPVDHHFRREDGRVLAAYQIVFLTEGRGWLESAATRRRQRLEAGALFLLFPGVWHRYAPEPDIGWVEHWMECRGPAFDRALALGVIQPQHPVRHPGLSPDLLQGFDRCHALAQRSGTGWPAALATLGLHLLALCTAPARPVTSVPRRIETSVWKAQQLISQRCHEPLNVERLAHELGEGYSNFRQAFRHITGLSPKQYHVQIRLQRAQDLLANTAQPVKEIADRLGFDSAFHLSTQFKAHTGLAPLPWRRRLAEGQTSKRQYAKNRCRGGEAR